MAGGIRNLIVVSDTHCGCRVGLCPPGKVRLDDGGTYEASTLQRKVWRHWRQFWSEWVPEVTHGEPFAVVINGDSMDGVHHGAVSQVSQNLADQVAIAEKALRPVAEQCDGHFYMIRGTEAHVGKSGQEEERLARLLGAVPDDEGRAARWEMFAEVGPGYIDIAHHIGTTSSAAYESSALAREMVSSFVEAGRWRQRMPDVLVRSHRHRHYEVKAPASGGNIRVVTTPGWQLKTPFVYRTGFRKAPPQLGGILVRFNDEGVLYTREQVWTLGTTEVTKL